MRRIIHNEWRYLIRNRLVQWITLGFAVVLVATIFLGKPSNRNRQSVTRRPASICGTSGMGLRR